MSLGRQRVACPAGTPSCTVMVSATASVARVAAATKRTITIGRASFSVKPGKSRAVSFRLTTAGRRALRRAGRLRANVSVAVYGAGATAKRTLTVTLRGR